MGAGSRTHPEVVDLTEDPPVAPQRAAPHSDTPSGRRKRTMYVSLLDDADAGDDVHEAGGPQQRQPSSARGAGPALLRRARRAQARRRRTADDLVVVSERQLTPQERLREVQEQHRQGKTVEVRQNQRGAGSEGPAAFSNAALLYSQHLLGGPLGPIRGRLSVPPPRNAIVPSPAPRALHGRTAMPPLPGLHFHSGFPDFLFQREQQHALEQHELEQALLTSMEDTSRRRKLDRSRLVLPPPPPPAREGFTHSLAAEQPLVCIRCQRELGQLDPVADAGLPADAQLQNKKVFVRGCGHAYCGRCTFSMKQLPPRARACLPECKRVSSKKRATFREVFT